MKRSLGIAASAAVMAALVVLVGAGDRLLAQTTTPGAGTAATAAALPTIQQVVEITRALPAGTTGVAAFTVPAGVRLVVTDAMLTNTGSAETCGVGIGRAGGSAAIDSGTLTVSGAPVPGAATTPADSTITGPLCVPPRTTLQLGLTTGLEFAAGQSVQLVNAEPATAVDTSAATGATAMTVGSGVTATTATTATGAVSIHLRGVLLALTG